MASGPRSKKPPAPPSSTQHVLPLCVLSGVLLVLSFPSWNQPVCAWVALVPWLLALRDATRRQAWWHSYLAGLIFFLGSIWWLTKLSPFAGWAAYLGWLLLSAYLALYFAVFGWYVHRIWTQDSGYRIQARSFFLVSWILSLVSIPSAWVALEYARTHALTGLGWNLLGYSQQPVLPLIQIADLAGVWGVSYVLVMMNVAISLYISNRPVRIRAVSVLLAAGVVLASRAYGERRLRQPMPPATARVAVVQGNIAQERKWDEQFQEEIVSRYEHLTREIAAQQPQLIVWPETAVPALLGVHPEITARVQHLAQTLRIPLMVGAPMGIPNDGGWQLTNSAAMIDANGAIVGRYDKVHLVPFGEFIPFEGVAPWLRDILPPIGEFLPGKDMTVFDFSPPVSVLVCFEDTFPELARACVRRGARLLMTITNDAWFGPTAAAYQHAQASTFRAVELHVPMIRAANTGWSGCIDANGRWVASVHSAPGRELFVEGAVVCDVAPPPPAAAEGGTAQRAGPDGFAVGGGVAPGASSTFYARWGDWFAWGCVLLSGCVIITSFASHGHLRRSHRRASG